MTQSGHGEKIPAYGILIMSVTHIFVHVFDRILPALMPVFRQEFNLSLSQLGILASIPYLFQTVLSIPSGYFTDRVGSRTAIALSFLISIASALSVTVSNDPLMLALSISGLALVTTVYHPASYSYTINIASEKNRSKALGMQNAGGPLGMALGPLSLTLIMGYLGLNWKFIYLFWIIPIIVVLLAVLRLKPDPQLTDPAEKQVSESLEKKGGSLRTLLSMSLIIFLLYSAVRNMGGQMIAVFLPTYLKDVRMLSVSDASLVYGAVSLTGVVAAPLGGFSADRFGTKRWLLSVLSSSAIFLCLAYLAPSTGLFLLFYFLNSFLGTCGMAANSAIVAGLTPRSQRGMGYALFFLPTSIIGSIAPAIAGYVADQTGLTSLFPLGIAVSFASLVLLKFGVKA